MASDRLTAPAHAVAAAIRAGDLAEARRQMAALKIAIAQPQPADDRAAAAAIILEARKLAIVHRAQVMQTLQSLVRQQLYRDSSPAVRHTFQVEG